MAPQVTGVNGADLAPAYDRAAAQLVTRTLAAVTAGRPAWT